MEKKTIAEQIIDKLTNSFGMTRAELAQSLGRQRDDIRKALNGLIKTGVVHRDTDNNGIEFLTIVKEDEDLGFENEKQTLAAEAASQEARLDMLNSILDARPVVGEAATKVILPPIISVEDTTHTAEISGMSYDLGFAQGFKEGEAKAQREAYAAGRKSVFDQIRNLLGGIEG